MRWAPCHFSHLTDSALLTGVRTGRGAKAWAGVWQGARATAPLSLAGYVRNRTDTFLQGGTAELQTEFPKLGAYAVWGGLQGSSMHRNAPQRREEVSS